MNSGDVAAAVQDTAGQVDGVLHLAGDGTQLAGLVKPGGRLASTMGFSSDQLGRDDLTVTSIMANPVPDTLALLAAAVADGTVRVPITRTYQLDELPQALQDFTGGALGKLAVRTQN